MADLLVAREKERQSYNLDLACVQTKELSLLVKTAKLRDTSKIYFLRGGGESMTTNTALNMRNILDWQ